MENKSGGFLVGEKDGKVIKHNQGDLGGVLVGKRHSEGGIKGMNESTGQPIEVESGEIQLSRKAVNSDKKHDFNGKMMTNKQILSQLNQDGGGVAFEDGGNIENSIDSSDIKNEGAGKPIQYKGGEVILTRGAVSNPKKYDFNGKQMTTREIASLMNENAGGVSFEDGGNIDSKTDYYSTLSHDTYDKGGKLDLSKLNTTEMYILHKLDNNIHSKCDIHRNKLDDIIHLEKMGVVYATQTNNHSCYHVRLTDYGMEVLKNTNVPSGYFAKGGGTADCGCQHKSYADGGGVDVAEAPTTTKYFKGIDAKYKNQFVLNKAIEELVESMDEDKLTPEEKNFIGYYAGYGGLEKYGATGEGLFNEFYTPSEIAKKMWGLAYKYGFKGGRVLEPACGIGEFIKYAPEQGMVTGYEINETSAKICRILYPQAKIETKYFETLFIKNRNSIRNDLMGVKKYDLVIGNPPYGKMSGFYAGFGDKEYTRSKNYIEYFISRGLDLLEKDGLLIYIIGTEVAFGGTPFLQQKMNPAKEIISKKAELLDAYRLPNGLFETTDVVTDIVVFRKK